MKCCICGAVKNVGGWLDNIFKNMEQIGSLFEDYQIILYYDNSYDNTLQKLKEYQRTNPKLNFFVNKKEVSIWRTQRIANARNGCLQMMRNKCRDYDMFIMMDCDDVCSSPVNLPVLKKYLNRNDWDSLSFNKSNYYDIWALSIDPYFFSFIHFRGDALGKMKSYISDLLRKLPKDALLRCGSAFNGFAIYRMNKFINCAYYGKPRLDLIPSAKLLFNQKILNSPILFDNPGRINEDCEHRAFHFQAIRKNNARIRISSEILFY